ncbi:MAG: MotA/TolQ/ExbB proton channel family protein, partial [Lachnospiraceae bacterium]|nr:MotA/TolQ/ExbB proton channel family protein [Lachnospiraceae bacterium]
GILGTVVGLMMQVSSEGLEQMTSSIGLALGTTFMGLSAALILKITDNIVGTSADKIVTIITKYDRKYHHATTKAQLEKGK